MVLGCRVQATDTQSNTDLTPAVYRWNFIHIKTYGGSQDDTGWSVQQVTDGYLIAGVSNSQLYLIRTDTTGTVVWEKTVSGLDFTRSVRQTSDGGFIVAGSTTYTGNPDFFLLKTNVSGELLWQKTFGGAKEDWGACVQQTSDNGYIMVGRTRSREAGEEDVYLVKTDIEKNII